LRCTGGLILTAVLVLRASTAPMWPEPNEGGVSWQPNTNVVGQDPVLTVNTAATTGASLEVADAREIDCAWV